MSFNLLPIDGPYFTTLWFWITTPLALFAAIKLAGRSK